MFVGKLIDTVAEWSKADISGRPLVRGNFTTVMEDIGGELLAADLLRQD